MSATKAYYEQFFQEEHHTDDTYEDFLRMQREHQDSVEHQRLQSEEENLEKINPIEIDWRNQAQEFLAVNKTPIVRELPF